MKRVRKHISRDLCDGLPPHSDRCILMLRGFGLFVLCFSIIIYFLFWRLCKAFLLCSGERDLWRAPSASVLPKLLTCCSFFFLFSSKQNSEACRQSAPSRSSCFSSCLFCFEFLIHTRVLFLTSLVARYASFIFFFFFFALSFCPHRRYNSFAGVRAMLLPSPCPFLTTFYIRVRIFFLMRWPTAGSCRHCSA